MTQTNFTVRVLFRDGALNKLTESDKDLLLNEDENCVDRVSTNLYDFGSFSDYFSSTDVEDMLYSFGLTQNEDFEIVGQY